MTTATLSSNALPPLPEPELERLQAVLPQRVLTLADGSRQAVRVAGHGPHTVVALHGIGSGAASWLPFAEHLPADWRLIAWDAPGYGDSDPLGPSSPRARDYALRLDALLSHLDVQRCLVLGHSLGAFAASAFCSQLARGRVDALALISPARGYGHQPARSAEVRAQRLAQLADGGVVGMASRRSDRLLSPQASLRARQWVRWNMARLHERGYSQAIEMLCGDHLLDHLPPPVLPMHVACGSQDVVTTPQACAALARACNVPLHPLPGGHASYVEQPTAALAFLRQFWPGNPSQEHA